MEQKDSELETFRRQWLEEVSARRKSTTEATVSVPVESGPSLKSPPRHEAADTEEVTEDQQATTSAAPYNHDEIISGIQSLNVGVGDDDSFPPQPREDPESGLEYFERAVIKEAQGNLGDSLNLYRKAYRLDSKVDQTYRKKHFSSSKVKFPTTGAPNSSSSEPATTAPSTAPTLPTPKLIESFASFPISAADPIIENTPPPPCPISSVPSEVLVEILKYVALRDPALYVRLALVCKRLAYHVAHEQHIWKRLCKGHEFGFAAMHYSFACEVTGHHFYTLLPRTIPSPFETSAAQIPKPLTSWAQVFQAFPRIRFTGIYISTVNYTRPGTNSPSNSSWNTPIHIVTYYRYLRFYPDGSLISLLTTTEPVDVVPHISKENLEIVRPTTHRHGHHHISDTTNSLSNPMPPATSAALKSGLRGRWHLTPPFSDDVSSEASNSITNDNNPPPATKLRQRQTTAADSSLDPRDICIETEGVGAKYIYRMHLSLRSTASGGISTQSGAPKEMGISNTPKNTKLVWKGFWSYNQLTDDWAEFLLRNDRSFVFRRVRGWGLS